ncbi:MAG: hypothetical protein KatS3mg038_0998 [Candidatus Kapaibacterium sp.]|nr:MAG: hypothetical protein KatS3mg038_0998 [Candidatus Kapabacteria bacterium]
MVSLKTAAELDAIGATRYGGVIFTPEANEYFANTYDFFLTCGRADANPTTLLEATSWGLLSFCTPQSGYYPDQPFIGVSLSDPYEAVKTLRYWLYAPKNEVLARQEAMRNALARYRWRHTLRPIIAYAAAALSA